MLREMTAVSANAASTPERATTVGIASAIPKAAATGSAINNPRRAVAPFIGRAELRGTETC